MLVGMAPSVIARFNGSRSLRRPLAYNCIDRALALADQVRNHRAKQCRPLSKGPIEKLADSVVPSSKLRLISEIAIQKLGASMRFMSSATQADDPWLQHHVENAACFAIDGIDLRCPKQCCIRPASQSSFALKQSVSVGSVRSASPRPPVLPILYVTTSLEAALPVVRGVCCCIPHTQNPHRSCLQLSFGRPMAQTLFLRLRAHRLQVRMCSLANRFEQVFKVMVRCHRSNGASPQIHRRFVAIFRFRFLLGGIASCLQLHSTR